MGGGRSGIFSGQGSRHEKICFARSESGGVIESLSAQVVASGLQMQDFEAELGGFFLEKSKDLGADPFATEICGDEKFIHEGIPASVFDGVTLTERHIANRHFVGGNDPDPTKRACSEEMRER